MLNFSVNEATAYHLSKASTQKHCSQRTLHAHTALWLQLAISVLAAAAAVAAIQWVLPSDRQAHLSTVTLYTALFIPLSIMDLHFKAVLQGVGDIMAANVVRVCQPIGYMAALIFLQLANKLRIETIMVAMLAAIGISLVTGAFFVGMERQNFAPVAGRELIRTGLKFHQANLLLYAATESDKFIVLNLMNNIETGYYAVALAVSTIGSSFVVQSLGLMLTRDMAASSTVGSQRRVFMYNVRLTTILLLVINGAAATFAPWWLPLLYGSDFKSAVPVAMILYVMGTLKGLRQIIDTAMRAARITEVGMIGEGITLGGLIAMGYAGAMLGGLKGLALGLVTAQAAALGIMIAMASRRLHIRPADFLVDFAP
jgi:O-antigen/teichoic acid export membrane protein